MRASCACFGWQAEEISQIDKMANEKVELGIFGGDGKLYHDSRVFDDGL